MTLKDIFSDNYLKNRAVKAVEDSLSSLTGDERKEFASMALHDLEAAEAPINLLDTLYLASL